MFFARDLQLGCDSPSALPHSLDQKLKEVGSFPYFVCDDCLLATQKLMLHSKLLLPASFNFLLLCFASPLPHIPYLYILLLYLNLLPPTPVPRFVTTSARRGGVVTNRRRGMGVGGPRTLFYHSQHLKHFALLFHQKDHAESFRKFSASFGTELAND